MIVVRFVGADGMSGMIDASITRSFSIPWIAPKCRRRHLRPLPVPWGLLTWRVIRISCSRIAFSSDASLRTSGPGNISPCAYGGEGGVTSELPADLDAFEHPSTVASFREKVLVDERRLCRV